MTTALDKLRDEKNTEEHTAILDAIKDIKRNFVQKSEFKPVRNVVYGMVGVILIFALTSLLQSVAEAAQYIF